MYGLLRALTLVLVLLAVVPAMAHVLELPGKLRLSKEEYAVVQRIYYPGFTLAGIGEPLAIVSIALMLVFAPPQTETIWLLLAGASMALMHAVYWFVTHPVNKFWLQEAELGTAGAGFFSLGSKGKQTATPTSEWMALRNRWEFSHVVRAFFAALGLAFLVIP
jgi:hypothetical protein